MSHILLVGFMGAGKSTVGRMVAEKTGLPFVDLDRAIESADGRTIAQIFAEDGEAGFRRQESTALQSLADEPASVVACGGGVVTSDENRRILGSLGRVVYLRVTVDEMLARVGNDSGRPLLAGGGGVIAATALLDAREALYSAVSDCVVDTVNRTPGDIADEIVAFMRSHDAL